LRDDPLVMGVGRVKGKLKRNLRKGKCNVFLIEASKYPLPNERTSWFFAPYL
ncbi:hypothetical protein H0H93_007844, partial [Arthromyces matolae]